MNQRKHAITFTKPSLTKQSFRANSTVDAILKKYQTLGLPPSQQQDIFTAGIARAPYGVQRLHDYQAELNSVISMNNYFSRLPAQTRDKFANDPINMLEWLADAKNHDEARKLKLLPELPKKEPEPPKPAPDPKPEPKP